jgi:opacity protein-like surface antigen
MSHASRAMLCALALMLLPRAAAAEWQFMPWVGLKFGTESDFVDPDQALDRRKTAWGATVRLQSDGIFGIEADIGYVPGFFEADRAVANVSGSSMTTLTGNIVLATPLSLTGDSLRPYFSGGVGLIRSRADTVRNIFPELNRNMFGFTLGGGAVGFLSERTGVRWDIRYFRSLSGEEGDPLALGSTWISFWRANISLVIRP